VSAAKHTPGPWRVGGIWAGVTRFVETSEPESRLIAEVRGNKSPEEHEERDANARLIAAAPDLLAFVRDVARLDPIFAKGDEKQRIHDARALVAAAESRP
jgi:hypothetical protein